MAENEDMLPDGVQADGPEDPVGGPEADAAESETGEARAAEADGAPGETPPLQVSGDLVRAVREELEDLRRKAAERDEYLELAKRAKADFVNYQKRVDEERKRWAAFAQRDLLARLLAACDHSSLAAKSAADDCSVESLRGAIRLVWSELEKFLAEAGVSPVATVGERFDPHVHEAVFAQESSEHPDPTVIRVIDEVKPGYLFGEQVLRPAQVVVTKRPLEPSAEGTERGTALEEGPAEGDNGGDDE